MKKLIPFISLTFLIPVFVFSQKQNSEISILNGFAQHQERLIHPKTYNGYRLGINFQYTLTQPNKSQFYISFLTSGVFKAVNQLNNDMSQLHFNLETGYLWSSKIDFWKTGPAIQAQYNYSLYSLNYGYPFWFTQYSINWSNQFNFTLTKDWRLNMFFTVPVLGFFSRTEEEVLYPYKLDYTKAYFHQNMSFSTYPKFYSFNAKIACIKTLNEKTDISMGYQLHYYNYNQSKKITSLYHALSIGIVLKK